MAKKQSILSGNYAQRVNLLDDVYALPQLTRTQQTTILLCAVDRLPAQVDIFQRTFKGTVELRIGNATFKISQRARVTEQYADL